MRKFAMMILFIPCLLIGGERYKVAYDSTTKELCPNCSLRLFREIEKINSQLSESLKNEKKMNDHLSEISEIVQQYRLCGYDN